MRQYLTVVENYDYDTYGLMFENIKNQKGYQPATSGRVIAHDLVEHVNGLGAIGTIHDELEALAGVVFVRFGSGIVYGSFAGLGGDLTELGNLYFRGIPIRKSYQREINDPDLDTTFDYLWDETSFDSSATSEQIEEFKKIARTFFKRGYKKHERKWRSPCESGALFSAIERAVDQVIPRYGFGIEDEGRRFVIEWDHKGFVDFRETQSSRSIW
jgi:hypothetical protein